MTERIRNALPTRPAISVLLLPDRRQNGEAAQREWRRVLDALSISGEVLVLSRADFPGSVNGPLARASGAYVLVADGAAVARPEWFPDVWERRHGAGLILAATASGRAERAGFRAAVRRCALRVWQRLLSLPVLPDADAVLFRREALGKAPAAREPFEWLLESIVLANADGWPVRRMAGTGSDPLPEARVNEPVDVKKSPVVKESPVLKKSPVASAFRRKDAAGANLPPEGGSHAPAEFIPSGRVASALRRKAAAGADLPPAGGSHAPDECTSSEGGRHAVNFATFWRLWVLRNSAFSADYDERAFNSAIPLQRYWHRRRHAIITGFVGPSRRILDVGCGSSRIVQDLPHAVGLDVQIKKLRRISPRTHKVVQATLTRLPFRSGSFETLVCSQVIEHVPEPLVDWREMNRVLAPNGTLVVGTPDYSTVAWPVLERLYAIVHPKGYVHEHINRYTAASLARALAAHGFETTASAYVGGGELIVRARKVRDCCAAEGDVL